MEDNTKMNVEEENKKSNEGEMPEKNDDFVVIREQIKARPINKAKLMRNTLVAAISAVVFGIVACITFFLLAPIVSGYFNKDENIEQVDPFIFPEETVEEEMLPEDMLIKEPEATPQIDFSKFSYLSEDEVKNLIEGVVSQIEFSVSDYQLLYQKLSNIAYEFKASMVRVTSVKSATDWMDTLIEGQSEVSGLLVADNDQFIYVLTYTSELKNMENIVVTFSNNVSARAEFLKSDANTGLCVLTVDKSLLGESTLNYYTVASFGSSKSNYLAGTPIIALGSPMGYYGSFAYGVITSNPKTIYMSDCNYGYITTDMNMVPNANGLIINLQGYVLGVIGSNAEKTDDNVMGMIGVSELKKTIEQMVNNKDMAYLGIESLDVPQEAILTYNAPFGAFILSVDLGSPAMQAGIQSGDIITAINGKVITNYDDFRSFILQAQPGDTVTITTMRKSMTEYKQMQYEVVLTEQK